jgi:hypothetical protein
VRFLICLFFLFFLFPTNNKIDTRLLPIVSEFFYLKDGSMVIPSGLSVVVGHFDNPNTMGICRVGLFGAEITISEDFMKVGTEVQLHNTVFHESFHCILNRGHYPPESFSDVRGWKTLVLYFKVLRGEKVPSLRDDHCPISIMYPYDFSDYCYMKHYREYMEESFDKKL